MRVLIINTSERTGGAAVADNRLTEDLNNYGVKAKMLVRDKQTDHITTAPLPSSWRLRWNFLWERFVIWKHNGFCRKNLFAVSIANSGTDITCLPEFKEADIIHLHWVNQGMLSLKGIRKILTSGKPVVWTMHDMWPCTGICHYAGECKGFYDECGQCWLLRFPKDNDLSHKILERKRRTYSKGNIHFVTCSHWLEGMVRKSSLIKEYNLCTIHNTLNVSLFKPNNLQAAREQWNLPIEKQLILFGAVKTTDKRKGLDYFVEACLILANQYPFLKDKVGVVIFGNKADELQNLLPFPVYSLGYIHSEREMAKVYNAVDVYTIPSLEDNLPNTIAEAQACGRPCVGFRVGGIPEMIDHQENGYIAEYRNAKDFAQGIYWVLQEADSEILSQKARKKAIAAYGEDSVAKQYIQLYGEALKNSKKHD